MSSSVSFQSMPQHRLAPASTYTVLKMVLPTLVTAPGSSFCQAPITLVVNGQPPRSSSAGPRLIVEGRNPDETIFLWNLLHDLLSRHMGQVP
jgi:hypothetical protein